jgi:hypothetical protein
MKTYTRLDKKHLNNLMNGKTVTITKQIHEGGSMVSELTFKTKKKLNQFHRNIEKGKGTRIKPEELDNVRIMNGQGIFDSIAHAFSNPIVKSIAKVGAPIAGNLVKDATGSQALGNLTNAGLNAVGSGIKKGKKGGSFFNTIKAIASNPVTKAIVKASAPAIGTAVQGATGSNTLGNIASGTANAYGGSGVKARKVNGKRSRVPTKTSGSGLNSNEFIGIGGTNTAGQFNNPNMHEKMAHLRSLRGKKSGGSFAPLGN